MYMVRGFIHLFATLHSYRREDVEFMIVFLPRGYFSDGVWVSEALVAATLTLLQVCLQTSDKIVDNDRHG